MSVFKLIARQNAALLFIYNAGSGAATLQDVRTKAGEQLEKLSVNLVRSRILYPLEHRGLIVSTEGEDPWWITELGRAHVERNTHKVEGSDSVEALPITPPRRPEYKGVYLGEDLRDTCHRPGAYDYRRCKSLINGKVQNV